MEVKVISSEMIKPSLPTPSHLNTFKLSFLDQLSNLQGVYASITLFYLPPTDTGNNATALLFDQLKVSLSKTLTRFYPLAARINEEDNNSSIECNDEGALFTHVQVSCHMSEFLKPPLNHNLLYDGCGYDGCGGDDDDSARGVQILVRLHEFACGGICIGVSFLHTIIDGATMGAFLKSWAASSTNTCDSTTSIDHEDELKAGLKLFPHKETHTTVETFLPKPCFTNNKKRVWARFVFDAKAISTLKSMINENPVPSRVILVFSFILNHVIAASSSSCSASTMNCQKQFLLCGPVNIRPRIGRPLSQNSIGNLLWSYMINVPSPPVTANKQETMMRLVTQQREAIAGINKDFLEKFQGERGYDVTQNFNLERSRSILGQGLEVETCFCTSWCRFGFSELDFGWGKPLWYCNEAPVRAVSFANSFLLIDTPTGDGIEAQLILDEALMCILQLDQDFLAFASINPSILP